MEFMIKPLMRYFDFGGRSRRLEYFMFILFSVDVSLALLAVGLAFGLVTGKANTGLGIVIGVILTALFSLAALLPTLAVTVRRLHDQDRSGWLVLLAVAPGLALLLSLLVIQTDYAASLVLILTIGGTLCGLAIFILMCLDGTVGTNRFGPDPKARARA